MRASEPPPLATWLLNHLRHGDEDEALLGDLLEDFRRGRSAAWYWRQVLAAILVGLLQALRHRWATVCFAILWTCGIALLFIKNPWPLPQVYSLLAPFYGWSLRFDFPTSTIFNMTFQISMGSALDAIMLSIGLGVYLGTTRSFTLRRLWQGSLIAVFINVLGNILSMFLIEFGSPGFVAVAVELIFLFAGLLLSTSVARRSSEPSKTKAI
jgi:hypothetical protein